MGTCNARPLDTPNGATRQGPSALSTIDDEVTMSDKHLRPEQHIPCQYNSSPWLVTNKHGWQGRPHGGQGQFPQAPAPPAVPCLHTTGPRAHRAAILMHSSIDPDSCINMLHKTKQTSSLSNRMEVAPGLRRDVSNVWKLQQGRNQ